MERNESARGTSGRSRVREAKLRMPGKRPGDSARLPKATAPQATAEERSDYMELCEVLPALLHGTPKVNDRRANKKQSK